MNTKKISKSPKTTTLASKAPPTKTLEEYSTESGTSYTPYNDPLDINRFLNLEDPIEPKIEDPYPSKQEDIDYYNNQYP